jgi:GPI transamidase subunit PIG-U
MFKEFRAFFKFVLHSQIAVFVVPIALRFHRRPLFSFLLHSMLVAIFKPYPLVTDTAVYLTLLPMFVPVLEWAQPGILLGFFMLLAAVMGPSTLYQWLYTASANSNFYYAFTMLWGGAQVVLMLLITHAVSQRDREVHGKPQRFFLPSSRTKKEL